MTKTALHIDEIKKEKIIHYGIQRNISEMDGTAIDKAITCILDFAEPRGLYEELPYDIPSHTFLGRQPFGVEGVQILPFLTSRNNRCYDGNSRKKSRCCHR